MAYIYLLLVDDFNLLNNGTLKNHPPKLTAQGRASICKKLPRTRVAAAKIICALRDPEMVHAAAASEVSVLKRAAAQ